MRRGLSYVFALRHRSTGSKVARKFARAEGEPGVKDGTSKGPGDEVASSPSSLGSPPCAMYTNRTA